MSPARVPERNVKRSCKKNKIANVVFAVTDTVSHKYLVDVCILDRLLLLVVQNLNHSRGFAQNT